LRNASKSYDDYINDTSNNESNLADDNNVNSLITLPLNDNYGQHQQQEKVDSVCFTPTKETKQNKTPLSLSPSSSSASSSSSSSTTSTSESLTNLAHSNTYDNNFEMNDFGNNILSPLLHTNITSTIPLNTQPQQNLINSFNSEIDEPTKRKIDEKLKDCSSESDSEINIYTPKAVDIPSAQRLAKRLFYLDGFKANDVVRHLAKKLVYCFILLCFS
jgi:hypothetical protein